MTREQRIVETLVELAGTLVEDFDVLDFLHGLTETSVELLDCQEAGLLLADAAGVLRAMASSSERTETLELLQVQHSEGPCYECYRSGTQILSEDLNAETSRWPRFAPAALEQGFSSVQTLPMRVHGETIGALNLFRHRPGSVDERDARLAQGMADIAAVALMQQRSASESQTLIAQLQRALDSRVVIEQAKGMVAHVERISLDAAFARIRGYARANNRRLDAVALDLVQRTITVSALPDGARGPGR